ncbi:MAG: hypothetical protein U9P44_01295 [archaeon]|nr:hypothetical protein [archaeon]
MTDGISYLIEVLNKSDTEEIDITPKEFIEVFRDGILTEPYMFSQLVDAYENLLGRVYKDWMDFQQKAVALQNLAGLAVLADHDFEPEIIPRASVGGPRSTAEYLADPEEYGSATKALADYVGCEGLSLVTKVFSPETLN